jgi:YdjC-like protein
VSAMVFMEDSERAAAMAREGAIDAGLHLNFTTPFSGSWVPRRLAERQAQLGRYLGRQRFAQVAFHPGLAGSFEYVVKAQVEEFARLYGAAPDRLDGHHHMHLCANVILPKLLPAGTLVRRNFSFDAGEKPAINRLYRRVVDGLLQRRHDLMDFFFTLGPLEPVRLARIFERARRAAVEVETHPVEPLEYRFLMGDALFRGARDVRLVPFSMAHRWTKGLPERA